MKAKYNLLLTGTIIFGAFLYVSCGDKGDDPVVTVEDNTLRYTLQAPGYSEKKVSGLSSNAIYINDFRNLVGKTTDVYISAKSPSGDSIKIVARIRRDTLSKSVLTSINYYHPESGSTEPVLWAYTLGVPPTHIDSIAVLKINKYDSINMNRAKISGYFSVIVSSNNGQSGYVTQSMSGVFEDIQLKNNLLQ